MVQRRFSLEVIVSCIAFYRIYENLPMAANRPTLVNLISFMTQSSKSEEVELLAKMPEFIVAATMCGHELVRQHPRLSELVYPHSDENLQNFPSWIEEQYARFGSDLVVDSCEDLVLTDEERQEIEEISLRLKERFNL